MAADAAQAPTKNATREERIFGWGLALIVALYLALGALYAHYTPNWQSPDEPAHYNYAAYLAAEGRLPVLQSGDYPAAYLEEIKARRFAPELSIDPIRYEAHQPPAYYALAAGLLRLAPHADLTTRLLLLRLLSVALGAGTLVTLALLIRRLFGDPWLALAATALAGGLPMYLAITAAVNNDALAFLMLGMVALRLAAPTGARWTPRASALLGLLLGLCLLTKFQAYVALPLVGGLWLYDLGVTHELPWRRAWRSALVIAGIALLMVSPWLTRNMSVYGWRDPLGLARHEAIVVGQLRTNELLVQLGWPAYLWRYGQTTFQSWWGQFGWMAAPLPLRIYLVLGLVSLLALLGVVTAWRRRAALTPTARRGLALLALWSALTAASYLWYNLQFVQFQGRYLFPALAPSALALAYGLAEITRRPRLALGGLALLTAALLAVGWARGDLPLYALALCLAAGLGVWLLSHLPAHWRWLTPALVALGLNALALYSLFAIIVPQLTP